jgi:MFS family permease
MKSDAIMPRQHRGVLAALIFSLVAVQGLTVNLMPVLFGTIARTFEINLRQQGQLQSVFLGGGMMVLLVSGYVTERIGAKRSGMVAVGLIGIGALLFGLARNYYEVLAGALVLGMGNYWVLAAYSAIITAQFAHNRQRMFMWATAAFAGCATMSTALFGYLVEVVPRWNLVFFVFTGLLWTWFAVFFFAFREKLDAISPPKRTGEVSPPGGSATWLQRVGVFLAAGIFNRAAFWLLGLMWILEGLTAGAIIAWTGRFFQMEYSVSDYHVGLVLSASSAGVFVGRMLMGTFLSGRFSDRAVMGASFAGGMLMYILILLVPSYSLGLGLMFLNGALIAAQAPTMYALASAKFGSRAATVIPLVSAIGNLGGLTGPTLIGGLASHYGLRAILWLIPVLGAVFVAIVFVWEIVDRRRALVGRGSHAQPREIGPKTGDQLA